MPEVGVIREGGGRCGGQGRVGRLGCKGLSRNL